jgi:hypothetical protein
VLVGLTHQLARQTPGFVVPVVLVGVCSAGVGLLAATGSISLATIMGVLAACVAVLAVLAIVRRATAHAEIVFALCGAATVIGAGVMWSDTPLTSALLLCVSLLMPWLVAFGPLRRVGTLWRGAIAVVLAALPAAVLVGWHAMRAAADYRPETTGPYGY